MAVAHPTVTSVRTFRYEMGKRALEMLIAAIDGTRPDEPVVDMGFALEARESTARKGR
jgi:LacI family gluconate utilization system Gnt-I transcriptional repressor